MNREAAEKKSNSFFLLFTLVVGKCVPGATTTNNNNNNKTLMCRIIFAELVNKFHIQRGKNQIYVHTNAQTDDDRHVNKLFRLGSVYLMSVCMSVLSYFEHRLFTCALGPTEFTMRYGKLHIGPKMLCLCVCVCVLQSTCLMRKFMQILKEKTRTKEWRIKDEAPAAAVVTQSKGII